jgi:hypothetical protein
MNDPLELVVDVLAGVLIVGGGFILLILLFAF